MPPFLSQSNTFCSPSGVGETRQVFCYKNSAALSGKRHVQRTHIWGLIQIDSSQALVRRNRNMERIFGLTRWPWSTFAVFCLLTLSVGPAGTLAMRVTSSGPQTLQLAQGERATVECIYTPDNEDIGELDIEWSLVNPDTTKKDQLIISYSGGSRYFHGASPLTEGVNFTATDPSQGDASLSIDSVNEAHAGTYQCKVKKSPGVDMHKVSLVVLERPAVPRCWVEGEEVVGQPVSLHCKSDQGSGPLQYQWRRESGGPIPPSVTQNSVVGELVISNHSVELAGIYSCEVANAVGKQRCRLNLQAIKPPNRAGVITGTVCGCLLLIIIIAMIIWLLVFRWERKRHEKEISNDIREDVPAPKSRSTSRATSVHSGVAYKQMGQTDNLQPSSTSTSYTASKYDSRFGYIV